MQSDPWTSVRHICDQFVWWQASSGGFDVAICPYHRDTPFGKPSAFGQDMPWVVRALYAAYDLLHEPKYKVAADRYAVFFIACLGDESPAWALGGALDPCLKLYQHYNPADVSLQDMWKGIAKEKALYRWLLGHRTEEPNYFNCGYPWSADHPDEDVGFSCDLTDAGRGLVSYHRRSGDGEALSHAVGLAGYFLREHRAGTMEGIWSTTLGAWLAGPRHGTGGEHLADQYWDEIGLQWSAYYSCLWLARLHDCIEDEELKSLIRDRCVTSLRWTFDACQFEDGAIGMTGRDDKWLGMAGTAVMQYLELYRRLWIDEETHRLYYPKALKALTWLREMSSTEKYPRDGYIPVTGRTIPWPGWNIVWLMALTADGLMCGPTLESLGIQNKSMP